MNNYDVIQAAIEQLRACEFRPSMIYMHPMDFKRHRNRMKAKRMVKRLLK